MLTLPGVSKRSTGSEGPLVKTRLSVRPMGLPLSSTVGVATRRLVCIAMVLRRSRWVISARPSPREVLKRFLAGAGGGEAGLVAGMGV
jgi:hypothetical protein